MKSLRRLFKPVRFDPQRVDWLFANFEWLLGNYGGLDSLRKNYHLFMEKQNDFPTTSPNSPEGIQSIFDQVMKHMGIKGWPSQLVPLEDDEIPDHVSPDESEHSMGYSADGMGGFFHLDTLGRATIGYSSRLTQNFTEFVSVLSHEAAHYLLTKSITTMPGGWKDLEPVTDLTAIFTELTLLDAEFVAKQLCPNPKASYRSAVQDIRRNQWENMMKLEAVTPLRKW